MFYSKCEKAKGNCIISFFLDCQLVSKMIAFHIEIQYLCHLSFSFFFSRAARRKDLHKRRTILWDCYKKAPLLHHRHYIQFAWLWILSIFIQSKREKIQRKRKSSDWINYWKEWLKSLNIFIIMVIKWIFAFSYSAILPEKQNRYDFYGFVCILICVFSFLLSCECVFFFVIITI